MLTDFNLCTDKINKFPCLLYAVDSCDLCWYGRFRMVISVVVCPRLRWMRRQSYPMKLCHRNGEHMALSNGVPLLPGEFHYGYENRWMVGTNMYRQAQPDHPHAGPPVFQLLGRWS